MKAINHGHFIVEFEDAWDLDKAQQLIKMWENHGDKVAKVVTKGQGENTTRYLDINLDIRTMPDVAKVFSDKMVELVNAYNKELALPLPIAMPEVIHDIPMKCYRANSEDKFEPHYDSVEHYCNRYIAFIIYLNDVEEGGETVFPYHDITIKPKAGKALMFPPFWTHPHMAHPALSEHKYVLTTFAVYRFPENPPIFPTIEEAGYDS
ncbi:MAG: hypothetical protein GJ680_18400 [Alteromonadaceae bacterium]|nr:hypothetical protein [Alteromonadaceae bacterium]